MPMNLEFVISAYGIWMATMIIYVWVMRRKLKNCNHALENLDQEQKS